MVNRDIPNLEELQQCSHHALRGSGGDSGRGRVPSRPGCRPHAGLGRSSESAYCVQDGGGGEAFPSSLPRNHGSQPAGCGFSPLWKEWGGFDLTSPLRAQGGAGRGDLRCHLCVHTGQGHRDGVSPHPAGGPDTRQAEASCPQAGPRDVTVRPSGPCFPVVNMHSSDWNLSQKVLDKLQRSLARSWATLLPPLQKLPSETETDLG